MDKHITYIKSVIDSDILNIYTFGSINYGLQNEKSDNDFMVVVESKIDYEQHETSNYDLHIFNVNEFQKRLSDNDIQVIEVWQNPIVEKHMFGFILNKSKLRTYVSKKADLSYVKAKKKIIIDDNRDYYSAKKSLFHSLRLLDFGIQLCKNGKIIDFTSCNKFYKDIMMLKEGGEKDNHNRIWNEWNSVYRKEFKSLKSAFKKVAPKIIQHKKSNRKTKK